MSNSNNNNNNNRTALQQLQMQIQMQMQQHRLGRSLASNNRRDELQRQSQDHDDDDDDLALFTQMNRNRRANFLTSSEDSESDLGTMNSLSRISTRRGVGDDLLSVDGDKNDYEWLLSPPPTPFFSSVDTKAQATSFAQRGSPAARPTNASRSLRLSSPHTDPLPKTVRGSLTSRQTISSGLNNSVNMASRRSTMLTSPSPTSSRPSTPTRSRAPAPSRPVSSRPSTPTRSTIPASSRPSTPTTRSPMPSPSSRPSTPTSRSTIPTSRPSTPTSRSTIPTSRPTVPTPKSLSRPSTPTRRPSSSTPSLTQSSYGLSRSSISSISSIPTRNPPTSRGSSPSPGPRPSQPPLLPSDFSIDTPPNLRTTMSQRPSSVTRGRPGAPSSARPAPEAPTTSIRPRGQSCSPVVTRGRTLSDSHSNGKSKIPGIRSSVNGSDVTVPVVLGSRMVDKVMGARSVTKGHEDQATTRSINSSLQSRRPVKSISSPDSTGFGRTISKKSLDMALRHMDIRQSTPSSIRPLTGIPTSSLYSVRSGSSKSKPTNISESPIATSSNGSSEHGVMVAPYPEGNVLEDYDVLKERENILSPLSQQGSILFKGDEQSTNWLHGPENVEEKLDQTLLLHRFEPFDALADTTGMGGDS